MTEEEKKIKKQEAQRKYREKNKERERERKRRWYFANHERIKEKHRLYRLSKKSKS